MRDRDAAALARKIADAMGDVASRIEAARKRLRTWRPDGFPPGGQSGGNSAKPHADPTAQAVQSIEVVDREGNHVGWRKNDTFGPRLRAMDKALVDLMTRVTHLGRELDDITRESVALDESGKPVIVGEDGCELCNAVRLPAGHKCDDALCARRDHRHLRAHQSVYNRLAPKPAFEGDDPVDNRPRCRFHFDFAARYGVDTDPTITLWHLDHPILHVPYSMIRESHADAWNRRRAAEQQSARA